MLLSCPLRLPRSPPKLLRLPQCGHDDALGRRARAVCRRPARHTFDLCALCFAWSSTPAPRTDVPALRAPPMALLLGRTRRGGASWGARRTHPPLSDFVAGWDRAAAACKQRTRAVDGAAGPSPVRWRASASARWRDRQQGPQAPNRTRKELHSPKNRFVLLSTLAHIFSASPQLPQAAARPPPLIAHLARAAGQQRGRKPVSPASGPSSFLPPHTLHTPHTRPPVQHPKARVWRAVARL